MKGFVFTEFTDMVDAAFGEEMTDAIIADSDLPSGGSYTAVGTYDYQEMVALVRELSRRTGTPVPELLQTYGRHLFGRFVSGYPQFFEPERNLFEFLRDVEDRIHVEVRKLYPEAELPSFEYDCSQENRVEILYRSCRPLGDFCRGLLEGCIIHFAEPVTLDQEPLTTDAGTAVRFTLTRAA